MNRSELIGRLDTKAGQGVERAIVAHHRRRLTRAGQEASFSPPAGGWAEAGWRPGAGNELELLVDGAEALPRIAQAIQSARRSVWLAGFFFTPGFRLDPASAATLLDLLAQAAERVDVRLLAWAGAPVPLFHPDRKEVRSVADELATGTKIRVALDARERYLHCHHEKVVVVDGETAFVGGIDLTSLDGDRLDFSHHPARGSLGWHDAAVRLRGPVVADVAEHFSFRWREVTGEPLPPVPPPPPEGDVELQLVRTVPEHIYRSLPHGQFGILESYLRALRSAETLVYLENQFLWSPEIVHVLVQKLRHPPSDRFRLVMVLPAKPNNGADDTRGQLGVLAEADGGSGRLLACGLYQTGEGAKPVYVHAKIGIVDDRWLTVGSANLNEHSLFNDTELNVVTHDPRVARAARLRLWSEHLDCAPAELDRDPAEVIDELWKQRAAEGLARRQSGRPLEHRLVRLPHVSRRTGALRGPLDALVVDG